MVRAREAVELSSEPIAAVAVEAPDGGVLGGAALGAAQVDHVREIAGGSVAGRRRRKTAPGGSGAVRIRMAVTVSPP